MNFAFISRHEPTPSQVNMAAEGGHSLIHIGDADAFTIDRAFVDDKGAFDGVVVVHPAAAMRLAPYFVVGVFENANRSASFEAVSFHIYDQVYIEDLRE